MSKQLSKKQKYINDEKARANNSKVIYVLNKKGKPLMVTKRHKHVRDLLKEGKAVAVNNNPFTIRLKYNTPDIVQELTLSIDPGRENIGLSVIDSNNSLIFSANVETNNKRIKQNMSERKIHRASRRRHKRIKKQRKVIKDNNSFVESKNTKKDILRTKKECFSKDIKYPGMEEYITHKVCKGKEAKFNNRIRKKDWLTPSARNLIQIYTNLVKLVKKFLPISKINIEYNSFDFQKLDNMNIKAWEYSKGPLYGFKSYKDYINFIQDGKCLMCKNNIEYYHHITYKSKEGTDNPKNIVGLCECCHILVHNDKFYEEELLTLKKGTKKEYYVGLLNTCMPFIVEKLNKFGLPVNTYIGKETKEVRNKLGIPKDHYLDAYCIGLIDSKSSLIETNFKANFYNIKHFKKKSNNIIHKLNKREYYYEGQLIAINRHKAFNQKEDSLEEYKNKFLETHNLNEWNNHFKKIIIKPAKRTYTYHKKEIRSLFKNGDKIKYEKKNKIKGNTKKEIFIAEGINFSEQNINHNKTKKAKFKYCRVLKSNSLVFI